MVPPNNAPKLLSIPAAFQDYPFWKWESTFHGLPGGYTYTY